MCFLEMNICLPEHIIFYIYACKHSQSWKNTTESLLLEFIMYLIPMSEYKHKIVFH